MHYPLILPYFMKDLYSFQRTTVISSLLHWPLYALLYIFSEVSTYLYDFQRVTIKSFKKEAYWYFFKKLMVTRWKIDNYEFSNTFSNTSGNVVKIVTHKSFVKFP